MIIGKPSLFSGSHRRRSDFEITLQRNGFIRVDFLLE